MLSKASEMDGDSECSHLLCSNSLSAAGEGISWARTTKHDRCVPTTTACFDSYFFIRYTMKHSSILSHKLFLLGQATTLVIMARLLLYWF
ncbi:hypothetical protein E4T56_gene5184 [Termitomyces sp. T112]|nr:hypothetical protein E4T56_gene5184 [Termitomyces sp. T112]